MPTRLWSLWEMYKVDASAFHTATVILHQAICLVEKFNNQQKAATMSPNDVASTKDMLRNRLAQALEALNVPVTKLALSDAIMDLEEKDMQYFGCGQLLLNISETLRRELTTTKVFALDGLRTGFYEPAEPLFGLIVASNFPSISHEIDQAGKCYACDLTTASAFHSIRCLESAIRAIARCLGIADPTQAKDRNWSIVSQSIKDKIDARWPKSTGRMNGDGRLFDEILGALSAIQNPYRNSTMHLDAIYTAPDAVHLFEMVKGLMQRVASRMDEQGLPLA